MNKTIVSILLFFVSSILYSQETGNDSYTIQRLIIFNENGDILLQKHKNGWMTPALRHNIKTTNNEGLENLASEFGLEISIPQLQGIFMYLHSNNKKPSFRQHYSAKLINGNLKIPDGVIDVQWFSPKKAINKMLNPDAKIVTAIGEMTKHILSYPKTIWGGSYLIIKKVGKKTESKVIENFYPIGRV